MRTVLIWIILALSMLALLGCKVPPPTSRTLDSRRAQDNNTIANVARQVLPILDDEGDAILYEFVDENGDSQLVPLSDEYQSSLHGYFPTLANFGGDIDIQTGGPYGLGRVSEKPVLKEDGTPSGASEFELVVGSPSVIRAGSMKKHPTNGIEITDLVISPAETVAAFDAQVQAIVDGLERLAEIDAEKYREQVERWEGLAEQGNQLAGSVIARLLTPGP